MTDGPETTSNEPTAGIVVWVSEPSIICASVKRLLDAGGLECHEIRVITGGLDETRDAIKTGRINALLAAS